MKTSIVLFLITALTLLPGRIFASRDREAEYQSLVTTAYEPRTGVRQALSYLDRFRRDSDAHIREAESILREYEKMADFDRESFRDLASLVSAGQQLDRELSASRFQGVRNAWARLYGDKRERIRRDLLAAVGESQFSPALADAARIFCGQTYLTWTVDHINELRIGSVELVENGTAKRCTAEYDVLLRGNIVGIRTRYARVVVRGKYAFDSQGRPHVILDDARIIDGPSTVGDLAGNALALIGAVL